MDAILRELNGLFFHFFGRDTLFETNVVVLLCLLFGAFALSRVSIRLGATAAFYATGIFLTAIGLCLIGLAAAYLKQSGISAWWMPGAAAVASVVLLVAPVTMLFHRSGYAAALIAWIVTLLVVTLILTLEPIAKQSIDKNVGKARQIEKHRTEVENYK